VFSRDPDLSDYRAILTYGPQLDADGIEVIFYSAWYENDQFQEIAKDLRSSGLTFPAVHAEKSIGSLLGKPDKASIDLAIDRLNYNCYFAQQIGAEAIVLHLWGLPESDHHFERNLEQLPLCADFAWRYRLWPVVETVPCLATDPLTRLRQVIATDARCRVALDSEFLAHHNQLDAALAADWLWQDDRVMHVHIKDYDGRMSTDDGYRRYLQPGEGQIDFLTFFRGLKRRAFKGNISLEASAVTPGGAVDLDRIKKSLRIIRDLMNSRG
jgi:sugar phosphate isomerase/epimerase